MTDMTPERLAEIEKAEAYIMQFLGTLENLCDHITDEGDRVYFGSTNDADELREVCDYLYALRFEKAHPSIDHLHGRIARLRGENKQQAKTIKSLQAEMEAIENLRSEMASIAVAVGRSKTDGFDVDWFELAKDVSDLTASHARATKLLKADLEFVALWCHREGISTDAERISVIKNYPPISALKEQASG